MSIDTTIPATITWPSIANKATEIKNEALKPVNIGLTLTVARCARFSEAFVQGVRGVSSQLALRHLRLLVAAGGVLIVQDTYRLIQAVKTTVNEKFEAALAIISNIGTLTLCTKIFTDGLTGIGVLPMRVMAKTTPLIVLGGTLEIAGLCLDIKGGVETQLFANAFNKNVGLKNQTNEEGLKSFQDAREVIKQASGRERGFVAKYFWPDAQKFNARLDSIEAIAKQKIETGIDEEANDGHRLLKTTLQSLSHRISVKKWSHALKFLANSVSSVGLGMILFPGWLTVGFGLMALGAAMTLASFVYRTKMANKFKEHLALD